MTTYTIDEIASIFRVTAPTVQRWIAAGMPIVASGRRGRGGCKTQIDFLEATRWWFKHNHGRLDLLRARTRLLSEQADMTAARNIERARDLAPVEEIETEFTATLHELRARTSQLGSQLAPALAGQSVEERKASIDRAVHDLLHRASAWPG